MYLQPKPKKPLGHPNPNGLIYLIHNETFIEKILKFTLATLGVLTLIVAILGIMLYRNLGGLPDESRFAHLSYYKNGQKNQQLLKKPKTNSVLRQFMLRLKTQGKT